VAYAMDDIDGYKDIVTWRLRLAVEHNAIVFGHNFPFYFGEAVAVLWKLKKWGFGVKKSIEVLGGMMGTVDFFRDFMIDHDTKGTYADARSRAVSQVDLNSAMDQFVTYLHTGTGDNAYIQPMREVMTEADWDKELFRLLAKLQVKTYRICSAVGCIMQKHEMN